MAQTISDGKGRKFALLSEEMYKTLKNINQTTSETESPEFSKVKRLDGRIRDILQNNQMPASKKAHLYSTVAAEYLDLRQRAPETARPIIENVVAPAPQPMAAPVVPLAAPHPVAPPGPAADIIVPAPMAQIPVAPVPVAQPLPIAVQHPVQQLPVVAEPPMAIAQPTHPVLPKEEKGRPEKIEVILNEIQKSDGAELGFDGKSRNLLLYGKKITGTNIDDILDYVTKNNPSKKEENKPKGTAMLLQAMGAVGMNPKLIPNADLRNIVLGARPMGKGRVIKWSRLR